MTNILPIRNPADLALPYAEQMVMDGLLDLYEPSEIEHDKLAELEVQAEAAQMLHNRYYVKSGRSFIAPFAHEREVKDVNIHHFDNGLDFMGTLFTYSTLRLKRGIGNGAIRALCLTFHGVKLLPGLDDMPEGYLLHTPAFAVTEIDQVV